MKTITNKIKKFKKVIGVPEAMINTKLTTGGCAYFAGYLANHLAKENIYVEIYHSIYSNRNPYGDEHYYIKYKGLCYDILGEFKCSDSRLVLEEDEFKEGNNYYLTFFIDELPEYELSNDIYNAFTKI